MNKEERANEFFAEFGIPDVLRVADPERKLYAAFDLGSAKLLHIAGVRTFTGAIRAIAAGHRQGKSEGDTLQMPGAFLLHFGKVLRSFYHNSPADRPDYLRMAQLPMKGAG